MQFLKKQLVLLSVHFLIQEKEKQQIHFTNANTKNEKLQMPYFDMWKLT